MRFFERPGGFRWYYYTTIRAKRKAADPKACRFNAFHKKTRPIKIMISHIQHFINAFQPVAYRCPAIVCLRCNVRQREPLNVPQKSYLTVYPPKRRWQHYASRRHGQHRARRAAAAVRRCALERSRHGNVPFCRRWQNGHTLRATKSGTHADHNNSVAFARM